MGDEEYWNSSQNIGFDFGDINTWAACSDAAPKLSAAVPKKGTFEELQQFHHQGFQECMNQKVPLQSQVPSPSQGTSGGIHSQPLKISLFQDDVLQVMCKEHKPVHGKTTPEQTVKNMVLGLDYSLEHHKALDEKTALLDAAIKSHDGSAITSVVLFLRKTLKKSVFHHEILERPQAIDHYLCYLEMDKEYDELSNMYLMLGKAEDAAMLKYKGAVKEQNPDNKIRKLENCLNTHFQITSVPPLYADSLSEHISLLQRQLPIEEDDTRQEKEGTNELFRINPRKHTLFDVPVITTLFYCCLYHYNLSENHLASPVAIRKQHQLTDKQFVWTALSALAQLQNWAEIESLFLSKSWLGSTRLKCCIGFNRAVTILAKACAPNEVLLKYIKLVEDVEDRLNLAKKYKFHKYVLELLTNQRDRQGLVLYRSELSPKSVEYIETEEVLQSSAIKWKN